MRSLFRVSLLFLVACMACGTPLYAQTTYNDVVSNDWNLSTTWFPATGTPGGAANDIANINSNAVWISTSPSFPLSELNVTDPGSLTMNTGATIDVVNQVLINGQVNMDASTISNLGYLYVGAGATGIVNMANGSVLNNGFVAIVGDSGGTGVVNVQDSTFAAREMIVGEAGVGNVNVSGVSTVSLDTTPGYAVEATLDIGRWGGTGTALFDGYSTLDVSGRTNIGNNNDLNGGPLSNGTLMLSGYATMNTHPGPMRNWGYFWTDGGDVYVGCNEWEWGAVTYLSQGGTPTGLGGVGSLTVKNFALLNCNGSIEVGINGGTGTMLVSNAALVYVAGKMDVGYSGGVGTLNLDGGTCITGFIQVADLTSHGTITFNGGTLTVNTASPYAPSSGNPFITSTVIPNPNAQLVVKAGGAIIDTNGRDCSIMLPLLHDAALLSTHDGGLTKIGSGTLTLNGDNRYFGFTTVLDGAVCLDQSAWLWMDVNDPGGSNYWTQIVGTGGADLEGKLHIDVSGVSSGITSGSWLLVHVNDLTESYGTGFGLQLMPFNLAFTGTSVFTCHNGSRTWEFTEATGILTLTTVPEPGTLALLAAGLIGLLTYAWRKRK